MHNTAKSLEDFYAGFGLPAYINDNVPDDVTLPYLTYSVRFPEWDEPITHFCTVYMRTDSIAPLIAKAEEIRRAIGTGLRIPCANGCLYLYLSDSIEILNTTRKDVKGIYIPMELNVLHS